MKMKKSGNFKAVFVPVSAALLLTSCATIVSGGSPKVTIDGDVGEPVTIVTEKQTYENVMLPCMVKVNRHKLDGQRIKVSSATTKYKDIILEKSVNPWAFGNILFGGVVGWGIDLGTNCVSVPSRKHFYVSADDARGAVKENGFVNF